MTQNFSVKYEDIIKHRSVWMGLAIIMVCILHDTDGNGFVIHTIKGICEGAVDIFFFASGIGCYHSLQGNPDTWSFFKKRIQRVYFVWLPLITLHMIITSLMGEKYNFFQIIGNLLCVGSRAGVGNTFNWYESALWIFYIIAPLLVSFVDTNQEKIHLLFFGFLVLFLISTCFFEDYNGIITFSRMPNAYSGIVFAAIGNRKKTFSRKQILSLYLLSIIGLFLMEFCNLYARNLLWDYGLYWYPFILITPGMCIFISSLFDKLEKIDLIISYIGKHSYEIYLVHVSLYDIVFRRLINQTNCIEKWLTQFKIISFILSISLGILYKKLFSYYMRKIRQPAHR